MNLQDIPMGGRRYTWYSANGLVKSKLDRVLI